MRLGTQISEVLVSQGHNLCDLPIIKVYLAREVARGGDHDDAIPRMRAAVDHLFRGGRLLVWGIPATGVLIETLLGRCTDDDLAEAEAAIERLAIAPADGAPCCPRRLAAAVTRAAGAGARRSHRLPESPGDLP